MARKGASTERFFWGGVARHGRASGSRGRLVLPGTVQMDANRRAHTGRERRSGRRKKRCAVGGWRRFLAARIGFGMKRLFLFAHPRTCACATLHVGDGAFHWSEWGPMLSPTTAAVAALSVSCSLCFVLLFCCVIPHLGDAQFRATKNDAASLSMTTCRRARRNAFAFL
jgi:hypothetical protein